MQPGHKGSISSGHWKMQGIDSPMKPPEGTWLLDSDLWNYNTFVLNSISEVVICPSSSRERTHGQNSILTPASPRTYTNTVSDEKKCKY
jgi:hypothetical protein